MVIDEEDQRRIVARLRYLYGNDASIRELFDRLVEERNAGLFGKRLQDGTIEHNGKMFYPRQIPGHGAGGGFGGI